jgi:hypothetical protein
MQPHPTDGARRSRHRPAAVSRAKTIAMPRTRWWWLIDQDDLTIAVAAVASAVAISLALM